MSKVKRNKIIYIYLLLGKKKRVFFSFSFQTYSFELDKVKTNLLYEYESQT